MMHINNFCHKSLIVGIIASALLFISFPLFAFFNLYQFQGVCGDIPIIVTPVPFVATTGSAYDFPKEGPFIKIHPNFLNRYSDQAATFVLFHECGHHVNGHSSINQPANKEPVADCYAAKRFSEEYGEPALDRVLKELAPLTGKLRTKNIWACIHDSEEQFLDDVEQLFTEE